MITSFPICLANSCIVSLHHIISFSSMESLCFSSRPLTFQVPKRNCFLKPKILPVTCFSWDAWLPASPWPVANFSPLVAETSGRPVTTRIAKHSRLKLQCLSYGLVGIVNVVVSPRFLHRDIFNLSGYIRTVTSLHLCFSLRYWQLPLPSTRIQKNSENSYFGSYILNRMQLVQIKQERTKDRPTGSIREELSLDQGYSNFFYTGHKHVLVIVLRAVRKNYLVVGRVNQKHNSKLAMYIDVEKEKIHTQLNLGVIFISY